MGKAARWFRNILGKKEPNANKPKQDLPPANAKRWSFGKSSRDSAEAAAAAAATSTTTAASSNAAIARAAEAAWLRSAEGAEREQSKHAIAVAAATAAAADAAVAAAQAAVAVVRLTSKGPVLVRAGAAAVRIQTAFRGFLARKALRALKALVKLQALVRGYLVRRQAAATLHSMQALIRAQAAVRAHRALPPPVRPRYSYSLQERCHADYDHGAAAYGASSRRLSESSSTHDRSPKIVEVDPGQGRPSRSSRRASTPVPLDAGSSGEDCWSARSVSSPLPSCYHLAPGPPRIATSRRHPDHDCCALPRDSLDKARPATAQSTPRYMYAPPTPAKSLANAYSCPGYMSSTHSSEAKQARSQSAPKQRPPDHLCCAARKRVPLAEVVVVEAARASLTGAVASLHRASCNAAQDAFSFKAAVVGRMDRTLEVAGVENDRLAFLHRRW